MRTSARISVLALLLAVAAGCATPTAPRLPPGEPDEPDNETPIGTAFADFDRVIRLA
jgi:hypothetical protein